MNHNAEIRYFSFFSCLADEAAGIFFCIRVTEQLVTHGGLGAIQYPLRGDERHDTADVYKRQVPNGKGARVSPIVAQ